LSFSIKEIFQARVHFFTRFSRRMACSMPSKHSKINQPIHIVFLGEAFDTFQSMLGRATNKIVGHTNVQRTADAIGKYKRRSCVLPSAASGILGRPLKPGDDTIICCPRIC